MAESDLTAQRLRELVKYNAETGSFEWIDVRRKKNGATAGGPHCKGYRRVLIDGNYYLAHRLAWLYTHGSWPAEQVDHINGLRSDNRLCNLRQATHGQNQQNLVARADSRTGMLGVYFDKQKNKFGAKIEHDKKRRKLGFYDDPKKAHAAYLKAKAELHTFNPVPRDA